MGFFKKVQEVFGFGSSSVGELNLALMTCPGPYLVWLTALGDTGYSLAMEMGASKESLEYPKAHAEVERIFMHLVDSLKAERLGR